MVNKITTPPTNNEVINKVNELVDDKQDTLVSGTNIKTVGGTSLLGSGNIALPTVNNATLTIQKNGTNVATFTANASSNVTANISVPNTVSSVSSSSTNADAVGAKLFYDTVGDIETALHAINSGSNSVNLSWYGADTYRNSIAINNEIIVSDGDVPSSETLIGSYSKGSEVVLYLAWDSPFAVNVTAYKLFINDTNIATATASSPTIEYTFTLTEDTVIRLEEEKSSTPTPPTPVMPS